jgi:iron complex outermembrane receptor protein
LRYNQKLTYAILAALGGNVGVAYAATETEASASGGIEEIVVTAQRRNESLENVPITIQAITGEQLRELNVTTFDTLLRYTPNVTYTGNGGGSTGNIIMRGLSFGGSGNQSQSTTAPMPNVALYLDDQSMQFPARNNDVYMVDMERIEVLEGPQGTLFGGGAEAGAIRYITNKPKLDVTEGNVNAGYGTTAGGDPNSQMNATINLPLIADTLAVRATIFDDRRGGYISNVPGTICNIVQSTVCANNGALVGSDLNTQTYQGFRLSALWKFNDDWNLLVQQNYQHMEADGYWSEYPTGVNSSPEGANGCTNAHGCAGTPLANYTIQAFTPAYDKDQYESTAWTLNGKVGDLKAVYTGSYLSRTIDQQADYSNYMRSFSGSYYTCTGAGGSKTFKAPGGGNGNYFRDAKPPTCYAPVGDWNDNVRNTHQSHEIRVSTNEDYRLRGLFGAFYEKFDIYDQMNFNYLPIPQCGSTVPAGLTPTSGGADCLSAVGPVPGYPASTPGLRLGTNSAFGEDVHRGYSQTAFFGSLDFDLIPKVLTLTGGTRYYHYNEFEEGSEYYNETTSPLILDQPDGVCTAATAVNNANNKAGPCGIGINLHKSESGFRSRANLTWHITPDFMAYYTFSQGFRPGGFNRTFVGPNGIPVLKGEAKYTAGSSATNQYNKPDGYSSDNLINNELGIKTEFLDHRVQVNVSTYLMHWQNSQLPLFQPGVLGNTTFVVNGPSYDVKGAELQIIARATDHLTIQGSSSWNSSSIKVAPCLSSNIVSAGNPTPIGQCITQVNSAPYTNPYGNIGSSPPFSPPLQFNLRARYDFTVGDFRPFWMIGANHIASMSNEVSAFASGNGYGIPVTTLMRYEMPGYTTYDGAIGVGKDNWTAQITGSNLTNNDASTNTSSGQFIKTEVPLRPRVLMLQFGYRF